MTHLDAPPYRYAATVAGRGPDASRYGRPTHVLLDLALGFGITAHGVTCRLIETRGQLGAENTGPGAPVVFESVAVTGARALAGRLWPAQWGGAPAPSRRYPAVVTGHTAGPLVHLAVDVGLHLSAHVRVQIGQALHAFEAGARLAEAAPPGTRVVLERRGVRDGIVLGDLATPDCPSFEYALVYLRLATASP